MSPPVLDLPYPPPSPSLLPPWTPGASFFYSKGSLPYEAYEVRAYGLLLNDMFRRLEDPEATLEFKWRETLSGIIDNCMHGTALQRLTFDEVAKQIAMLQRSVGT